MVRLVIVLCLPLVIGTIPVAECARRKAVASPGTPEAPRFATLRAAQPSFLVGGRGGQREVRYLSVRVSNIGEIGATDVQVFIEGSSGLTFPLRGPKKIASRAHGVYILTVRVPSGVSLQPHAIVTCSNCRR